MIISFCMAVSRRPIGAVMSHTALAGALARMGHEVHVTLGMREPDAAPLTDVSELPWLDLDDGVELHLTSDPLLTQVRRADVCIGAPIDGALPLVFMRGEPTPRQRDALYGHGWPMVVVSRWLEEMAVDNGFPPHRLVYVPNGVDHDSFRVTTPIAERTPQVAMLAHRHPLKRSRVAMDALEVVRERHPEVRAVAYGTDADDGFIPDWIRYHQLPRRSTLVDEVYNQSQVFVCSSVSEGFGRPSIEAMASGCALVTVDNGGSREFAFDGDSAVVVPPDDVDAIAAGVESLVADEDVRVKMARRAVEVAQGFDWETSAAMFDEFLQRYVREPERYTSGSAEL